MLRKVRRLHSSALNYFMAVAEERSFRGAARRLNIAPSAINRHILLLEEELGFQLFERTSTALKLSAAGEIVRRHCAETLRSFEHTKEALDALRDIHSGTVRVASSESLAAEFVPMLCSKFSNQFPRVELKVSVTSSKAVFEMVDADEVDVGFAFGKGALRHGTVSARFELPIGAIVGRNHPLATRRSVTIADCFEHQVVFPDANLSYRRRLDEVTDRFSASDKMGIEASSPRLMVGIARLNRHVAFMTPFGIEREIRRGDLVFLPIEEMRGAPDQCVLLAAFVSGERFAARRFLDVAAAEILVALEQAIAASLGQTSGMAIVP